MTIKAPTVTGYLHWGPSNAYKTWYQIHGTLPTAPAPAPANRTPIILIHGGPGATSTYMSPLTTLTASHGPATILYDQLGNGRSTHLPHLAHRPDFWTPALFLTELALLIRHLGLPASGYALLGNSWGGLLAALFATQGAPVTHGLRRIVASNAPADMRVFVEGCRAWIRALPGDVRETIERCEREGKTESEEYRGAVRVFMERHVCRKVPWPREVVESLEAVQRDGTVYETMNGPSEFNVVGSLKGYSIVDQLEKIEVPTLVVNGQYDEVCDEAVAPFFRKVRQVKWVTIENAAHMTWFDAPERYREVVGDFLTKW